MKEWMKKHKSELIVGVIASLLGAFIVKAVSLIANAAPNVGHSVFSALGNLIFYQAAHQNSHSLISILFTMFHGFMISSAIIAISGSFKVANTEKRLGKAQKLLDEIESGKLSKEDEAAKKAKAKEIIEAEKKRISKTTKINPRKTKTVAIIMAVILAFFGMWITIYEYVPATLWSSFELSVTKIAPYVEEADIKMLRSKWVSMDSVDDYQEIIKYINEVKDANGLSH